MPSDLVCCTAQQNPGVVQASSRVISTLAVRTLHLQKPCGSVLEGLYTHPSGVAPRKGYSLKPQDNTERLGYVAYCCTIYIFLYCLRFMHYSPLCIWTVEFPLLQGVQYQVVRCCICSVMQTFSEHLSSDVISMSRIALWRKTLVSGCLF